MDHCQVVMGVEQGREMRETFERVMGEPCPCYQGLRCPLLQPLRPAPRHRAEGAAL